MNFWDRLSLAGRKYERRTSARSGGFHFSLAELLETFGRLTILELRPNRAGKPETVMRLDRERGTQVSLLDGIAAIHSHNDDWYEVYRTAPSGELSKVRIIAFSRKSEKIGELQMLISERRPHHYLDDEY